MPYLYETHLHTCQGSGCGISKGRDYIQRYLDLGYTGIIVTDHFYNGHSSINRNIPWEKWVNQFCRGYEDAREEGARRGLDVFFGWEETFNADDYLVYGLDKQWLLEHPEVRNWTREEQFEQVRYYGGCVVQAHPFRQASYINCIHLYGAVDGVEVANRAHHRSFDALALIYARKLGLPVTAGSDIHWVEDIRFHNDVFGIFLDKKIEIIDDYVNAIRNNTISGLKIPAGHTDIRGDERIMLPVDIRDKHGISTRQSFTEFLL